MSSSDRLSPREARRLAVRLRHRRERDRLSPSTVAFLLGVPVDAVRRIEGGLPASPATVDRVEQWLDRSGSLHA